MGTHTNADQWHQVQTELRTEEGVAENKRFTKYAAEENASVKQHYSAQAESAPSSLAIGSGSGTEYAIGSGSATEVVLSGGQSPRRLPSLTNQMPHCPEHGERSSTYSRREGDTTVSTYSGGVGSS